MEKLGQLSDFSNQTEDFERIKASIEKELSNLKKIVDKVSQMRVETVYLESDLITTLDAHVWEDVSELIGLTSGYMMDVVKKDP